MLIEKMQIHSKPGMFIPMDILSENGAQKNHGQTLSRLNERGGLSFVEAAYIINGERWNYKNPMSDDAALIIIFNAMMQISANSCPSTSGDENAS